MTRYTKYPVVDGVQIYPDGREVCLETKRGREIYRARTIYLYVRQGEVCARCGVPCTPTFDHERCRGGNGAFRDDRTEIDGKWLNAALCTPCQGLKGSRRYEWREGLYVPVAA